MTYEKYIIITDLFLQETCCDSRGLPGWEAVDNLSAFLLNLNRIITAFSTEEEDEVIALYSSLNRLDKKPTKYSQKSKKTTLPGPWRASRKRSGSAPGQQAAERYIFQSIFQIIRYH